MLCLCFRIQCSAILALLYSVSGLAAATLPFDRTSPVIYDNDGAVESGFTDVYIMALASAGVIDLRGIISTGTNGEQPPFDPRPEDNILLERRELVAKARRSGMRNLPDPSPGPGVSMSSRRPSSGRIEDTLPFGAQGSWLIVNEARKATRSKPLVVVMGGQGSAVADAYLLDNSIADKVVVAWLVGGRRTSNGILDAFEYNAYVDSWATYIIFERLRVVAFPVDDAHRFPSTPKSRLFELPVTEIRQYMLESRWPRGAGTYSEISDDSHDWDAIGAIALTRPNFVAVTKQMSFSHWEADRWGGPYRIPVWKEDPNGRAMVVWQADAAVATDEWWSRMKDPAAWGASLGQVPLNGIPWPAPGTIEAENFDHGGTNVGYFDNTNNWTQVAWFTEFRFLEHVDIRSSTNASGGYMIGSAEQGEWTKYSIAVGNSDLYTLEVGVASNGTGGTFHVEFNGVDKTGPINVPNTGGWNSWIVVRKLGISLSAGPQVMRLVMDSNGPTGQIGNFDYLKLIASSAIPLSSGVTVVATDPSAAEAGTKTGTFTVTRAGATSAPLTVFYTLGGSATNGADYSALSGTLTFQPGQASATIAVVPVDDNLVEGSETVVLSLSSHVTYTIGAQASATITIADNDTAAVLYTLTASPSTVAAGVNMAVNWTADKPTSATDWIGFYPVQANNRSYDPSRWVYTSRQPSGTKTFVAPSAAGTYEFRYLLNDQFTSVAASDPVMVLAAAPNQAPVIQTAALANPNSMTLPAGTLLSISARDPDNGPNALTYTWSKLSGPGTVSFSPNGTASSNVSATSFTLPGIYVLRVAISDGAASISSDVSVTVLGGAVTSSMFTANPTAVAVGGVITLTWSVPSSRAGHTTDWIGLFPVGATNASFDRQRWIYTKGQTSGTYSVTTSSASGEYEFRYLFDDGFTSYTKSNNVTVTITTATATPVATLFGFSTAGVSAVTSAMAAQNWNTHQEFTIGVKFTMSAARTANAIRFWKVAGDTATSRTVGLYSSGGVLLASATSSGEPSSGWVSVPIQPMTINKGSTYVAAMFTPTGSSGYQYQYHAGAISSPAAVAPANAGVYVYAATMMYPTDSYLSSGYFIDVEVQ